MKYIFGLLIIVLVSCSKDDIVIPCQNNIDTCESPIPLALTSVDTCFELPFNNLGQILSNYTNDYKRNAISNGVVDDEFIFIHHIPGTKSTVYKSNLCNEYYEQGFDMRTLDNSLLLDWNQNDELLLKSSEQIWRVNFDGTDLVKITNDEGHYRGAKWCLNDSLIYCVFTPYDSNHPLYPGKVILLDRSGDIAHVFPTGIGKILSAIRGNKILTTANNNGDNQLGYIDIDSKEFIPILSIDINAMNGFGFSQYVWLNDDEVLYQLSKQASHKLIKLNINTIEKELIFEEDCENILSGVATTFSNNQEEIIIGRAEYRYVADHPDSLYFFQEIIKKNIVTGEEWLLDIDL